MALLPWPKNCFAIKEKKDITNCFLYAFDLEIDSEDIKFIKAEILYKGSKLVYAGKNNLVLPESQPITYAAGAINKIGNLRLPFYVPKGKFYVLLSSAVITEQAITDNEAFTIQMKGTNVQISKKYHLPETFNIIGANAFNIHYLKGMKQQQRDSIINYHSWTFSLSTEEISSADTTLTFHYRDKLPKGITMLLRNKLSSQDSGQTIDLNSVYLFKNEWYMPYNIANSNCKQVYITMSGKTCAMAPCTQNSKLQPCNYLIKQNGKKINLTLNIEK